VALLEATRGSAAWLLARQLGMQLVFGHAHSAFHIAWLSRLPVTRSANHRLPGLAKTLLELEIVWQDAPLRLFATHLAAGGDSMHPAQEAPLIVDALRPLAGQPYLLVGDFNSLAPSDGVGPTPPGWEPLRASLDDDPRRAVQLILEAGHVDCFRALHPDAPGYTYPTNAPWLRLDYIFASPALAEHVTACDVVADARATRASDHFPLWATLG
jgi:exodeoxyribonuclease-3